MNLARENHNNKYIIKAISSFHNFKRHVNPYIFLIISVHFSPSVHKMLLKFGYVLHGRF
jgi:hypothetical protein